MRRPTGEQTVAQSSIRGVVQGAAGGIAGFPETVGRQRQAGQRWLQDQFDRIDRGERPHPGHSTAQQDRVTRYFTGGATARQELRAGLDVKPVTEEPAFQLGERIRRGAAEAFPIPPEHEDRFPVQLGKGVGSTAVFLGGGVAGRLFRLPAFAVTAGTGAAVNSANTFRDALSRDASFEDASKAAKFSALVGTT